MSDTPQFLIAAERRQSRADAQEITMHAGPGHNRPPVTISETAKTALRGLSDYLQEHPVILTAEQARLANDHCAATERTIKDIDAERRAVVDPLNAQVKHTNETYRRVLDPLRLALDTLKRRLTDYALGEERKRRAEADRLRAEADAKERAAREAERLEKEAQADAEQGVYTDVGGAIAAADQAFGEFTSAERAATIAEHDVPVRLPSMFGGRARTLRTTEVLHVTDAAAALADIGLTDDIRMALLTSARAYRKAHGRLPRGISREEVRSL